jgi:DNA-binding response OmpR family regulator
VNNNGSDKKTVLIIDDNRLVRELLTEFFRLSGYETYKAENGEAALELIKGNRFDIVITDCFIPGISGIDIARMLSSRHPDSIVIGISAERVRNDFIRAGADAFLQKPFSFNELMSVISSVDRVDRQC